MLFITFILTLLNTFVSAHLSTLLVILSLKSSICIKNNKGSYTDAFGTQVNTYFQFETSPSTTIRCVLSVSHCSTQLIMPSQIPWVFNLCSNLSFGTVSKAFWKSKLIISYGDASSIHLVIPSKNITYLLSMTSLRNPC